MVRWLARCLLCLLSASLGGAQGLLELPWNERETYRRDLAPAAQAALDELPDAPVYHLELVVSDDWRQLAGRAEIRYTHTAPELLDDLVLRLSANALGSRLSVGELRVDAQPVSARLEQQDTVLRVPLPRSLLPGETVTLQLEYQLELGEGGPGYGRLGRYEDVLSLPDPYPVLSVYRDGQWDTDLPEAKGDPLVAEASFYLARVSFPAAQDLVASGRVVKREVRDGRQTVDLAAGPVRDLYLALTEGYQLQSLVADATALHSYAPAALAQEAAAGLEVAAEALELFSELYAPYPYRELEFVAVPVSAGGIEYPGVINLATGIYRDPRNFSSVVVHEVAHQWSFNLVGSDQISEPWLDEALAQYLTLRYHEVYSSPGFVQGYLDYWRDLWQSAPDPEQAVGLPVAAYERGAYSPIVYGRGLFFFRELERQLGRETLDQILRSYYRHYAWRFVSAQEFAALAEAECRCELNELFSEWVGPSPR